MIITSPSNPKIKAIRKLRDKKYRKETNSFFVEGIRIVSEAIESDWEIEQIVVCPELLSGSSGYELISEKLDHRVDVLRVDQSLFHSLSTKDGPKGLAAVIKQKHFQLDVIKKFPGCWVALDRVADPGNLGTIMRTCDAVGAKGVILVGNCTDPYDPSSIRGSMGAVFSLFLVQCEQKEFVEFKNNHSIHLVGTSDHGTENYQSPTYPDEMILIMGSEREGLHENLWQVCDRLVQIPMQGKSDSLNLSVACGVCLYEIYNQHRVKSEVL
ncbi:MAG: RNA methyltransferase [Chloroflexi bacterium HGW-Chloroflexi-10]|nr:MAG: RNA methyltransferase [Chloroflexi bacterium HGW-Chloroflexi-10]